jgi:hypothetical protein
MAATELLPAVIAVDSPVEGTLSVHTGANEGENFVMAVSKDNPKEYFKDKGYPVVLSYDEMIL